MTSLLECFSEECLKKGLHLRFSYYQFPVYIQTVFDDETGNAMVSGVFPEHIIPFVFGSLNITYEFIFSDVLPYGNPKVNDTWPGDIGMLQANISDVCVGAHNVEFSKLKDFCPLEYFQRISLVILASVGKKEIFDFFNFLYGIDTLIWFLLLVSMVSHVVVSSLSDSAIESGFKTELFWKHFYSSFWIYLASIFCEGSPRTMTSRRAQLLLFLWLFVVLVLVNILFSQFKGILMVQFDDSYMKTVEDLARKPNILPLIVPNSITETVLRVMKMAIPEPCHKFEPETPKDSPLEPYRRVYRRAANNPEESFVDMSRHLDIETYQLVKDGTHVLLTTDFFGKYILKDICSLLYGKRKLYYMPEELTYFDLAFQINWDFPSFLRNKLNERILWMKEGGFVAQWLAYYYKNFEKCQEISQEDDNLLLKLKHLESAFILILSLLAVSSVVYFFEFVFKKALK